MRFPGYPLPPTGATSVEGAPEHEHWRSPAARAVAELAADSGLLLAHHEARFEPALPERWCGAREDLAGVPEWRGGALKAPRYLGFRHDNLIGVLDPVQRPKWTAHELCHGLVGFGYWPGATLLDHCLAGWLAETLPVALWYFLDEAGLRRCARHAGQGPLFSQVCADCDQAARQGLRDPTGEDAEWQLNGRRFVQRQLRAVERSRKLGRPLGGQHANLDLSTDALAYAEAHHARLSSPEFERFTSMFFSPGQGLHGSLDALVQRVQELTRWLLDGAAATPLSGSREDRVAQDLGWRLICIQAQTEGEASRELDVLIDALASARDAQGLAAVIGGYRVLHAEWVLPEPEEVFGVGYQLPGGFGFAIGQMVDGVRSSCPRAADALGLDLVATVRSMIDQGGPCRVPLGVRFAQQLDRRFGEGEEDLGLARDLALFEASLSHALPADRCAVSFDPDDARDSRVMCAEGLRLLELGHALLDAREDEEVRRRPCHLAVYRAGSGEIEVVELPGEVASALLERCPEGQAVEASVLGLASDTLRELLELRVLRPAGYRQSGDPPVPSQ